MHNRCRRSRWMHGNTRGMLRNMRANNRHVIHIHEPHAHEQHARERVSEMRISSHTTCRRGGCACACACGDEQHSGATQDRSNINNSNMHISNSNINTTACSPHVLPARQQARTSSPSSACSPHLHFSSAATRSSSRTHAWIMTSVFLVCVDAPRHDQHGYHSRLVQNHIYLSHHLFLALAASRRSITSSTADTGTADT